MTYTTAFLEHSYNTDSLRDIVIIFGVIAFVIAIVVFGIIAIVFMRSRQKTSESLFKTIRQYFNLAAQKDELPDKFVIKGGAFVCGENSKTYATKETDLTIQLDESPQVKLEMKNKDEANT